MCRFSYLLCGFVPSCVLSSFGDFRANFPIHVDAADVDLAPVMGLYIYVCIYMFIYICVC